MSSLIDKLNKIPYYNEKHHVINTLVEEKHEQRDATRYIEENDIVLELGARYGTVSNIINKILSNPHNHVVVEPDNTVINALTKNRDSHHCHYRIYNGYISNTYKKIIYDNYGTRLVKDNNNENLEQKLSWEEFKQKYKKKFDTLVIDCEGCFCDFLDDIGKDIHRFKKLLFEKDFPNICNYRKIHTNLIHFGFIQVKEGFHSVFFHRKYLETVYLNHLKYNTKGLYYYVPIHEADLISKIIKKHTSIKTIVDCTSGIGGNVISFSKYFSKVISLENNPETFDLLKKNVKNKHLENVETIFADSYKFIFENYNLYNLFFIDLNFDLPSNKWMKQTQYTYNNENLNVFLSKLHKSKKVFVFKVPSYLDVTMFQKYKYSLYYIYNYKICVLYI